MSRSVREVQPDVAQAPKTWAHAVVGEAVHCRTCGYNLQGLRADHKCPECGALVWATIEATVDPAAARLPSLRNPAAVGNALLVLSICILMGALLMVAPGLQGVFSLWSAPFGRSSMAWLPALHFPTAIVLGIAGLWTVWVLSPPSGAEPQGPVWRDLWRIAGGLVGWLAFGSTWQELSEAVPRMKPLQWLILHVATAAFSIYGLWGLRGVFDIIGRRSRVYRLSHSGRQSLELIAVAIFVGVLASTTVFLRKLFWPYVPRQDTVLMLSNVVLWITMFMVLIGLGYLVINAWWIRISLRRPPPAFEQVLLPPLPTDAAEPPTDDIPPAVPSPGDLSDP